jgi:hypothetical protein
MWSAGAVTPEELETMFEDAFVVGDPDAVTRLFEDGGLLATASETRSGDAIGPFAAALWAREVAFLASPRRVLQAHDTALVVSERSVSVLRRAGDGFWRYVISLLDVGETTREEHR